MGGLERPDLFVLVRLLETVRTNEKRLSRTQLQIAAGMNYTQFERYLELSLTRRLLRLVKGEEGPPWVELTQKGYDGLMFLARGISEVVGTDVPLGS